MRLGKRGPDRSPSTLNKRGPSRLHLSPKGYRGGMRGRRKEEELTGKAECEKRYPFQTGTYLLLPGNSVDGLCERLNDWLCESLD